MGIDNNKLQQIRENMQMFEEIKNNVRGKHIVINGRVKRNEMFDRLELIVNSFNEPNPGEIAENLLKEIKTEKVG